MKDYISFAAIGTPTGGLQTSEVGFLSKITYSQDIDFEYTSIDLFSQTEFFLIHKKTYKDNSLYIYIVLYRFARQAKEPRPGTFYGSMVALKNHKIRPGQGKDIINFLSFLADKVKNNLIHTESETFIPNKRISQINIIPIKDSDIFKNIENQIIELDKFDKKVHKNAKDFPIFVGEQNLSSVIEEVISNTNSSFNSNNSIYFSSSSKIKELVIRNNDIRVIEYQPLNDNEIFYKLKDTYGKNVENYNSEFRKYQKEYSQYQEKIDSYHKKAKELLPTTNFEYKLPFYPTQLNTNLVGQFQEIEISKVNDIRLLMSEDIDRMENEIKNILQIIESCKNITNKCIGDIDGMLKAIETRKEEYNNSLGKIETLLNIVRAYNEKVVEYNSLKNNKYPELIKGYKSKIQKVSNQLQNDNVLKQLIKLDIIKDFQDYTEINLPEIPQNRPVNIKLEDINGLLEKVEAARKQAEEFLPNIEASIKEINNNIVECEKLTKNYVDNVNAEVAKQKACDDLLKKSEAEKQAVKSYNEKVEEYNGLILNYPKEIESLNLEIAGSKKEALENLLNDNTLTEGIILPPLEGHETFAAMTSTFIPDMNDLTIGEINDLSQKIEENTKNANALFSKVEKQTKLVRDKIAECERLTKEYVTNVQTAINQINLNKAENEETSISEEVTQNPDKIRTEEPKPQTPATTDELKALVQTYNEYATSYKNVAESYENFKKHKKELIKQHKLNNSETLGIDFPLDFTLIKKLGHLRSVPPTSAYDLQSIYDKQVEDNNKIEKHLKLLNETFSLYKTALEEFEKKIDERVSSTPKKPSLFGRIKNLLPDNINTKSFLQIGVTVLCVIGLVVGIYKIDNDTQSTRIVNKEAERKAQKEEDSIQKIEMEQQLAEEAQNKEDENKNVEYLDSSSNSEEEKKEKKAQIIKNRAEERAQIIKSLKEAESILGNYSNKLYYDEVFEQFINKLPKGFDKKQEFAELIAIYRNYKGYGYSKPNMRYPIFDVQDGMNLNLMMEWLKKNNPDINKMYSKPGIEMDKILRDYPENKGKISLDGQLKKGDRITVPCCKKC